MKAGWNEEHTRRPPSACMAQDRELREAVDSASIEIDQSHHPHHQEQDQAERAEQKEQTVDIDVIGQ